MPGLILPNDFRPEGGIWTPRIFEGGRCPCPCCSEKPICSACETGTTPRWMQLTVSGFTNAICKDCALLDGTYILSWCGEEKPCRWALRIDEVCDHTAVWVQIGYNGPYRYVHAAIHNPTNLCTDVGYGDPVHSVHSVYFPSPFDCTDELQDFLLTGDIVTNLTCYHTATWRVTAIP
jgi:hypothetical protein